MFLKLLCHSPAKPKPRVLSSHLKIVKHLIVGRHISIGLSCFYSSYKQSCLCSSLFSRMFVLEARDGVSRQSQGKVCLAWEVRTNRRLWTKAVLCNAHCKLYRFPVWGSSPLTHSIAYMGVIWFSSPCPVGIRTWGNGTNAGILATAIAMRNRVLCL